MKLSDTQLVILNTACQRDDRVALPLPASLKDGAAQKVVASLLARGLIEEVDAGRDEACWRKTGDGHGVTLVATDTACEALGIERATGQANAPQPATGADTGAPAEAADDDATTDDTATADATAPKTRAPRAGTKQATLVAMLGAPDGATIAEVMTATGWQPHTVRGAIAGALKKRLGLTVTSAKVEGRGRVYRVEG